MTKPVELAGDVVTGASALAGLFLVYLGNIGIAFDGFTREERGTVRGRFQTRAWLAFVGIVLAILSAILAILGKWTGSEFVAADGAILLVVALGWGIGIAIVAAKDVR
jgi:hypothetical protein